MRLPISTLLFCAVAFCLIALEGCHRSQPQVVADLSGLPPVQETEDKITTEISHFLLETRSLYNASKFDDLEALADQLRNPLRISFLECGSSVWLRKLTEFDYDHE